MLKGSIPDYMRVSFDRAVEEVSLSLHPRPSHVLSRLKFLYRSSRDAERRRGEEISSFQTAGALYNENPEGDSFLTDYPAIVLQAAREALPRQPVTPRDLPRGSAPTVAEAFAGGGLLSLAFHVEGGRLVGVCEKDPNAVATLRKNLHLDIRPQDANRWDPVVPVDGLDILAGGPPCQSFSPARYLTKTPGLGASSADNMYPRVLDWIADTQPRVVILENSAAVATRSIRSTFSFVVQSPGDQADEDARAFFRSWWENLDRLGYEGLYWVLYAPDFGTPQNRLRAWVVAWPKGSSVAGALRAPPLGMYRNKNSNDVKSKDFLPWVSSFDRIVSGCCGSYGQTSCINLGNLNNSCFSCRGASNFVSAPNTKGDQGRIPLSEASRASSARMATPKQTRLAKYPPIDLSAVSAYSESFTRVTNWLSKAIVSHFGKYDRSSSIVPEGISNKLFNLQYSKIESDRRLFADQLVQISVREAAKLQDVPQWWEFSYDPIASPTPFSRRASAFRQIGNGVPVNMGRAVVQHVFRALGVQVEDALANKPHVGLWPMDRVDPCSVGSSWFDRSRRPLPTREDFIQFQRSQNYFSTSKSSNGSASVLPGLSKPDQRRIAQAIADRVTPALPPQTKGKVLVNSDSIEVNVEDSTSSQRVAFFVFVYASTRPVVFDFNDAFCLSDWNRLNHPPVWAASQAYIFQSNMKGQDLALSIYESVLYGISLHGAYLVPMTCMGGTTSKDAQNIWFSLKKRHHSDGPFVRWSND